MSLYTSIAIYIHIYLYIYIYVYFLLILLLWWIHYTCVCLVSQSCPTVTPWTIAYQDPVSMGTSQARILKWVAMPSSRGSSQSRDQTQVSHIACGFFYSLSHQEALGSVRAHSEWLCGALMLRS